MVEGNKDLEGLLAQSFEVPKLSPVRKQAIWDNIVANVKPLDDAGILTGPNYLKSKAQQIHRRK